MRSVSTRYSWAPATVLVFVAACGAPGAGSSSTATVGATREPSPTAETVPAEGAVLLERVPSQTYFVSYEMPEANNGQTLLRIASAPPRFSWRMQSGAKGGAADMAQQFIQVDNDHRIGCIWVGKRIEDPKAWECLDSELNNPDGVLGDTLGGMLFGRAVFDVKAVAQEGWETSRKEEVIGRDAVCGSSPAFVAEVAELCLDVETGVPLTLRRGPQTYIATEFRAPTDEDFTPPGEPQTWD